MAIYRCSFCQKKRDDLISGPDYKVTGCCVHQGMSLYICSDCTAICVAIWLEKGLHFAANQELGGTETLSQLLPGMDLSSVTFKELLAAVADKISAEKKKLMG